MSGSVEPPDFEAELRGRLDRIERHTQSSGRPSRHDAWIAFLATALGAVAALAGAIVGANRAADTAEETANITIEADRRQLIATRRLDAFGDLARTARDQLRELEKYRDILNRDETPPRAVNEVVGPAFRAVRNASVFAELVGDPGAAERSRCLSRGFLVVGNDLGNLAGLSATADDRDVLRGSVQRLATYINDYIDYASAHLHDPVREADAAATSIGSSCPWGEPVRDAAD